MMKKKPEKLSHHIFKISENYEILNVWYFLILILRTKIMHQITDQYVINKILRFSVTLIINDSR